MAKSDIIASLKLNSTDYEQKLAKAKESTRKFSKDGGQGLTDMVGKFKGLAVAVAGSKAVMETFNAVVKSSQTIGDAYTIAISQARGSVDEFVYAMANADFSGFNNGLRGIMENAKEAAASMDALGNAQISYDYLTAGYRSSFKTNMATAKDKSLSKAERDAAYNAALGSLSSMEMAVTGYTDKIVKAVVDNAVAKANNINRDYVTRENIDRIMALDLMPGGDEEKARLKAIYDQYKDIREKQMAYQREAERQADRLANGEQYTKDPLTGNMELNLFKAARIQRLRDEAQAEADRLNAMVATNAEYQQAALYNAMLVKGTDEWLQEMTSLIIKADNAKGSLAEMQTATYEVANQLNQPIKAGTVGEIISPSRYKSRGLGSMAGVGAATVSPLTERIEGFAPVAVFAEGSYEAYVAAKQGVLEYAEAMDAMEAAGVRAADSIYAISNAMGNLSGVVGENAASWMSWGANVLGAIGQFAAAMSAGGGIGLLTPASSILSSLAGVPSFGSGMNRGEIRLRVQGGDLVGSISNYNRIASRRY